MPSLRIYNIFVSHSWTYSDEYYRFIRLLDSARNFSYRNYSVPTHDPLPQWKLIQHIENQIRPSTVVVILAGTYANYSDWIQKEIQIAQQLNKKILGVQPWGGKMTPRVISDAADLMVGWNTDSIVSAIRRLAP